MIADWLSPVKMAFLAGTAVVLGTVFFLATPLFFLFDLLLVWLTRIFSSIFTNFSDRLGLSLPTNLQGFESILPDPEEAAEVTGLTIPESVTRIMVIAVMLGLVLLVSLALTRRFRHAETAPRAGGPIRDFGEEAVSRPNFGQRMLQRLGFLTRWRTAASIRSIYQQMCQAAASVGYARSDTETPYEYLDTLAKVWPDDRPQSMLITEAYIRIRYGEIPETKDELEEIQEAWRMLEQSKPTGR